FSVDPVLLEWYSQHMHDLSDVPLEQRMRFVMHFRAIYADVLVMSSLFRLCNVLLQFCVVKRWHRLVCLIQVGTSNHGPLDALRLSMLNMMQTDREMIAIPPELVEKMTNPPKTMDRQVEEQQHLWALEFPLN